MKLFSNLQKTKFEVVEEYSATTRADRQGNRGVCLNGPQGTEYNLDYGTARAILSCPVNLFSLSRLVGIRAVLHFKEE